MCIKIIPLFVFFHCIPSLKIDRFLVLFQKKFKYVFQEFIAIQIFISFLRHTEQPPPQNGPIYQLCIFYIFLITGNMLTRSEPSLDMDPGSSVWISVRITPTLYPGVYWAGFFKNAQNMFNKTCVLFEICLEFCKNLWNME